MCHWTVRTSLLFLLTCTAATGADTHVDPLFASNDLLEVRISAPLTSIMRHRDSADELAGTLQYQETGSNEVVTLAVALRARGHFRRRQSICDFAPLRLNFKKSQTRGTLFDKQDKLKLVTHCKKSQIYKESLLREYLAYRVFNILTDVSLRVRLLKVDYVDTTKDNRKFVNYAFLIEDEQRFAKRIEMPAAEIRRVTVPELRPEYTNLTALFHYFLANYDFSYVNPEPDEFCCHNHILFGKEGEGYYPVPYDFDMSGFVDTPHSGPPPSLNLYHSRARRYRGWCVNNKYLNASVELFTANRDAIIQLVNADDIQRIGARKSLLRFIDEFYEYIESPDMIDTKLVRDCLPLPDREE